MIVPEARKALEFMQYKIVSCLREEEITLEDFRQLLVAGITPLLRAAPSLILPFLRWLGQWCEKSEIQAEAQKRSRWGAWGLRQFAKIMRGIQK